MLLFYSFPLWLCHAESGPSGAKNFPMKRFFTHSCLLFTILIISTELQGQNLTVTKHDLSDFHSNPTNTYFAEDAAGHIWALQWGGFTDDHIVKYDGSTWAEVPFDECNNCTRRIVNDNNGVIFLTTTQAFYSWDGAMWVLETGTDASDSDVDFDSDNALWLYDSDEDELEEYRNGFTQFYSNVNGNIKALTVAANDWKWMRVDGVVKSFSAFGLTEYPEFFSPLHIEAASDGKVWITNGFGDVGYFDGGNIELDVLSGIIPGGVSHTTFAIDPTYDFFWFGIQGAEAGLMFYNGTTTTLIPTLDLYSESFNLPSNAFVASDGSVWVGANFTSDVAQVTPEISSVFEPDYTEANLFPNPVSDIVFLEMEAGSQGIYEVNIFDATGRLVKNGKKTLSGNTLQINVEALPEGPYFITVPAAKTSGRFMKK